MTLNDIDKMCKLLQQSIFQENINERSRTVYRNFFITLTKNPFQIQYKKELCKLVIV